MNGVDEKRRREALKLWELPAGVGEFSPNSVVCNANGIARDVPKLPGSVEGGGVGIGKVLEQDDLREPCPLVGSSLKKAMVPR